MTVRDPLWPEGGRAPSASLRTRLLSFRDVAARRAVLAHQASDRATEAGEDRDGVAYDHMAAIHEEYARAFSTLESEAGRGAYT